MKSEIHTWAMRHQVPVAALSELLVLMGACSSNPPQAPLDAVTEAGAQARVRLAASKVGMRLWRNNVGAAVDASGRHIRYGIANESQKMNAVLKSSDLIGIKPTMVLPNMVGTTVGIFTAREIKKPGWKYAGTDRERAQLKFIEVVTALGGDAKFSTGEI